MHGELCADEAAALARERELLLALKPRFNRAGIWSAPPKFLAWRGTGEGFELAMFGERAEGWEHHGPLGSRAAALRALLVRLFWCAFHPSRGIGGMPARWFAGHLPATVSLPWGSTPQSATSDRLRALFAGEPAAFVDWLRSATGADATAFDRQAPAADLESFQGCAPPK